MTCSRCPNAVDPSGNPSIWDCRILRTDTPEAVEVRSWTTEQDWGRPEDRRWSRRGYVGNPRDLDGPRCPGYPTTKGSK